MTLCGHLSSRNFEKSCSHDCIQLFQHCKKSFKNRWFFFHLIFVRVAVVHTTYNAPAYTRTSPIDGCAATLKHKISVLIQVSRRETANFMYGMHNMIVGDASAANNATHHQWLIILTDKMTVAEWQRCDACPRWWNKIRMDFRRKSTRLAKNALSTEFRAHTKALISR